MKVTFVKSAPAKSGSALVIAKSLNANPYAKMGGKALKGAASAAGFKGDKGQSFTTYVMNGDKAVRVFCKGRGKSTTFDYEMCVAQWVKSLRGSGETTLNIHLDGTDATADDAARAALGARLAGYVYDKRRSAATKSKKPPFKTLRVVCDNPAAAKKSYDNFYAAVGDGTMLARDLVNEPPNMIYPKAYSAQIKKLTKLGLKVEVLGEVAMKKLGMNALLGVGQGSVRESQLVVMTWNGGKKGAKPAMLVGKGVTFDTGGISLKPGANMWDMKGDMGGSAAVVGAMCAVATRKAKANVIGIVGLVENMPDGNAMLPGDIITSMSGQTIEVQNTDAEGRLVLCDALHYGITKYKPKAVIDLATLTGAIIIALGHEHAGLFSNNDDLAAQIMASSETSTDKTWRLPLGQKYDDLLKSQYADMKNIGGRAAGSITAAQFLQRFVGKDTPWAHLDIAGTGMVNGSKDPRNPTFGTGFGVRLLNRWIADNHES